jgi:hyperosmotically inducible protein
MKYMSVVSAIVVTLAVAGLADAQSGRTITERIDDAAITAEVKARLVAERPANLTSVDVDTRQGVVRLHGTVPTPADKATAERIARGAHGVESVYNDLVVQHAGAQHDVSPAASPASGFIGRHTMTGEVTDLDASHGRVEIQTSEGELDLHFPPSALRDVKRGDRLTVELAVRPAP